MGHTSRQRHTQSEGMMEVWMWWAIGLGGWAFGLACLFTLMQVSHREDHTARKHEKRLDPYSNVTVTRTGPQ